MTKIKDRKIKTGYQPTGPDTDTTSRQQRRTRNAARWFNTLVAAIPILEQQADDWAEGFTNRTGGPGGRHANGIARPVEAALFTPYRQDEHGNDDDTGEIWTRREGTGLGEAAAHAAAELDEWLKQGSRLTSRALRLLPQEHPVAEMLARHAQARFNGAGECGTCGTWVEGVDADQDTGRRLRRGVCPACYKRWDRAGKPDFTTWAVAEWHRNGLCQQAECLHDHGDDEPAGDHTHAN